MKVGIISTTQYNLSPQKPNFRAHDNEWQVFGVDEGGQPVRDYIRKWHEAHYIPYQSIYETEGRKSEFEVKQMVSDLVRKTVPLDNEKLNELGLCNLNQAGKTIYRGAMLEPGEVGTVNGLYDAGIRRIMSIGSGFDSLQEECKKFGIDYLDISFSNDITDQAAYKTIDDVKRTSLECARYIYRFGDKESEEYLKTQLESWKENSRLFIDKFIHFIQNMQKGNVYMGCICGTHDTDLAFMFEYLFNPKTEGNGSFRRIIRTHAYLAEGLFHNLTESDKLKMGWSKDFEKTFFKRLGTLMPK